MQQKCFKSDIYVNEIQFCDTAEQAIDVDFTLPDYCPDISKIFKCHAVPRIVSKSVNGSVATIDGNVVITVLYCDKDSRFCSYEYQYPFSKNIDLPSDAGGGNVFARVKCEYINCRAVTGRKVDIHGAVGVFVKVFKRKCNEIISDIDDNNIEFLRIAAPATVPMGYAEKYLILEEDISVGSGQLAIESILKTNSAVCVKETKVINDKAVVKGELTVCILYSPEGKNSPQVVKTVLPFSQIVDVEGITDSCECECKAEIAALDIKPKISSNGETKCFGMNVKILLTCEAYCGNEIPVICDAFSRKYEASIVRKNVAFDKITCDVKEVYNCKKNIEFDFNINNVVDLWCSIQNIYTKFEEDNMVVNGTLVANMIVCDENNIPLYIDKSIDFEYRHPFSAEKGTPHCDPEIEVLSCGYTITSSTNMEIRVELGINASIYEKSEMSLICDMEIDETKAVPKKTESAMIVYFTSAGESLWDVANKFGASINEIADMNNIEEQKLEDGKMLLIPIN